MSEVTPGQAPHVSVILVSFNTRELTLATIDSLYASVVDPEFRVEVIVADNASHDGSASAVAEQFPQVTLIRSQENLGFGRGNNLGARSARGRALLLLNTDTIVGRGAVEAMYESLYRDSGCGVVGAYLENPDGSYQNSVLLLPTVWRTFCTFFWLEQFSGWIPAFGGMFDRRTPGDTERTVEAVHGAALMIRRDLFERLGGFDPAYFMYFEECDLCRRVADEGAEIRSVPSARIVHLEGQSSRERPGWIYHAMRVSRMIYVRKHLSFVAGLAVPVIVGVGYALRIILYSIAGIVVPRLGRIARNIVNSYLPSGRIISSSSRTDSV